MANDIQSMHPGDKALVLTSKQLIIAAVIKYEHPRVYLEGIDSPIPENIVYKYSPEKLDAIQMDQGTKEHILLLISENKPVVLGTEPKEH